MKMNTLNGSLVTEVLKSMQYYFSLALSFVPNVGDESLAETIFLHLRHMGYHLQFVIISSFFKFFLSQPPLDIYFLRYIRI